MSRGDDVRMKTERRLGRDSSMLLHGQRRSEVELPLPAGQGGEGGGEV